MNNTLFLAQLTDLGSEEIARGVFGGYTALAILIPVMIALLVVITFIIVFTLFSMSLKLSEMLDMLRQNQELEYETIPASDPDLPSAEISPKRQSTKVAILGIIIGLIMIITGAVLDDSFWPNLLYATGFATIVISVLSTIRDYASKDRKDADNIASDADDSTLNRDENLPE